MARVTVEDCLGFVANRFELVMLASKRARQLANGKADATVPVGSDKFTVVALREIAAGNVNKEMLDAAEAQSQQPRESVELIDVEILNDIQE